MPFPRQSIEFVGNLGKPAEARYTPQGTMIVNFSMAVTRQWGQGEQKQKETIWVNVSAWDKLGESCQHLQKGQQVLVKGYLKPDPATGAPRVFVRSDQTAGAAYELTAQEVWLSIFKNGGIEQLEQEHKEPVFSEDDIPF